MAKITTPSQPAASTAAPSGPSGQPRAMVASSSHAPADPRLVLYAVAMVRRRAGERTRDGSLTRGEVDRAIQQKTATFGRMTTQELAAKLLLDLNHDEFYSDLR